MSEFFISIDDLKTRMGTADCPLIFDVRRLPLFEAADVILPTAHWRDHIAADVWARRLPAGQEIVVYCVHGHNVSQCAGAGLRSHGVRARVLEGGIEGWKEAGGPVIRKDALLHRDEDLPSTWVTRVGPDANALACAWLVRRFIDPQAHFLFVAPKQVAAIAEEIGGMVLDGMEADQNKEGRPCAFETLVRQFGIDDAAIVELAKIMGRPDPTDPDRAPESAGVSAIVAGVSALSGADDHAAVARGLQILDALLAWQRRADDSQGRAA